MKALVGAFNQEKALVGAFSVIVKTDCGTDGSFYLGTPNDYSRCQVRARAASVPDQCCQRAAAEAARREAVRGPSQQAQPGHPDHSPTHGGHRHYSPAIVLAITFNYCYSQVFSELLSELVPGAEHPEDLEMLVGVAATSQEMQDRVLELVGQVGGDWWGGVT